MASVGRLVFRALVLPCAVATVAAGQATSELRGRVLAADGTPIPGASVTLATVRYTVHTDIAGAFTLGGTPGGTLALVFSAQGYRDDTASVVLSRGRPVERDFVLVRSDEPVPGLNPSDRVLRGVVTDTDDNPIAYANIQLNGGRRVVADDRGRFSLAITVGDRFSLLIRRIGFEPEVARFESFPDTAVRMRMTAAARVLPEMLVTERSPFASLDLHGFYRRMAEVERGINHGYFVTPEELDLRKPANVTDAVAGIPTIRIAAGFAEQVPNAWGGFRNLSVARNMRIEDMRGCPLTVYLDRIQIQPASAGGGFVDTQINPIISPASVAGIEVYPRAIGAPPEFQANNGTCGVVLIWSK